MARQWRIEYKGAIYHILSRGNQKQAIFKDDKDREAFIDVIKEAVKRFSIEVYAYVLMGNHYHLMLKTQDPNLSKTMQWIGTAYTRRYHLRHKECGHLFQGRFKSVIVEDETYLLRLSYYIHRNPLRAGMVSRLIDYRWSSYAAYAYQNHQQRKPGWLNTDFILSKFNSKDRCRSYRMAAQDYSDETVQIWEEVKHGLIFGSDQFVDKIRSTFLKASPDAELPQHNRLRGEVRWDEFILRVNSILNYDVIKHKITKHSDAVKKRNRNMVIYALKMNTTLSNPAIGRKFGVSYSAISKIVSAFREQLVGDMELQERLDVVNSQFKV